MVSSGTRRQRLLRLPEHETWLFWLCVIYSIIAKRWLCLLATVNWLYLSSEIRRVVKVVGTKIVSTWLTDTRRISTCARKSWYLFYFLNVRRRAFRTVKCTVSHRTSYIIEPGKAANVVQLPFITYWYRRQAVTFNYYRIETFWLD